jgi:hypothetical protein
MQFLNQQSRVLPQRASAVFASFVVIALIFGASFSFPHEAQGAVCGATSISLNNSSYSATVGGTFSVTATPVGGSALCTIVIQDNTTGSFLIVPTTDTDLDCNGATCSGPGPGALVKTLKCEGAGTYTIRASANNGSSIFSSNSTVTCNVSASVPARRLRLLEGFKIKFISGTIKIF